MERRTWMCQLAILKKVEGRNLVHSVRRTVVLELTTLMLALRRRWKMTRWSLCLIERNQGALLFES